MNRQFAFTLAVLTLGGLAVSVLIFNSSSAPVHVSKTAVQASDQDETVGVFTDRRDDAFATVQPAGATIRDQEGARSSESALVFGKGSASNIQSINSKEAMSVSPLNSRQLTIPRNLGPATTAYLMGTQPPMGLAPANMLQNVPADPNASDQPVILGLEPPRHGPPYPYTVAQEWYRYWYGWAAFNNAQLQAQNPSTN